MMVIRVIKADDELITKINGTVEEIAKYYFPDPTVQRIEFLEGAPVDGNEYYQKTVLALYRAPEAEIKEFDLQYNIRMEYRVDYKEPLPNGEKQVVSSCGYMKF